MNKAFVSIAAIILGGSLSMGCMNTATFDAKDGNYNLQGRSSNPEAMASTLSVNRSREIYAGAFATAVAQGSMYPYGNVGPVATTGKTTARTATASPPPANAPATKPTTAPTSAPTAPATTPEEKPVSRQEFDALKAQAADTTKKADVSIGLLKTIRKDKQGTAPATPPAAQPLSTTPAQQPLSGPEVDQVQKQANEARKRAEAATASTQP